MMEKGRKKSRKGIILAGVLALGAAGAALAYYSSHDWFHNRFLTPGPGIKVIEEYDPQDRWLPGEEKVKEVKFANTGELDMYLRFRVEASWGGEGQPAQVTDSRELTGPDGVLALYWRASRYGDDPAEGTELSGEKGASDYGGMLTPVLTETGELDEDGNPVSVYYYYYGKVLKPGDETENVLESVKFSGSLSNDGHEHSDYSGVQIDVDVKGEAVLADPEAAKEQWGMDVSQDPGKGGMITWTEAP